MKIAKIRSAFSVLFSALLVFSFIPSQALAEGSAAVQSIVEQGAVVRSAATQGITEQSDYVQNVSAVSAGAAQNADAQSVVSQPNAAEQQRIVTQDIADQEASIEAASGANDVSTADASPASDNADTPNPGVAPLVSIIEDDEAGNPHAQMYTTLLDADGKVVDTNDPNYAVDKKYQPTSQGGEGAGLNKGANVTVHFRMAAITPQNADGEGTGVQEQTTYTMDLPWQLVAAKEDKEGNKLVDSPTPFKFFTSSDTTAEGGVHSKFDAAGDPLVTNEGDPLYEFQIQFANVEKRVDISGDFQYVTTVSDHVAGGSTVVLTYVPGGTVSFKVNEDMPSSAGEEYSALISAAPGGQTSYYVYTQLRRNAQEGAPETPSDAAFAYKNVGVSLDNNMGVLVDEAAWSQENPETGNVFNAYKDESGPRFRLGITYEEKDSSGNFKGESFVADPSYIVKNSAGETVVRFAGENFLIDVAFSKDDALSGSCIESQGSYSYIANRYTLSITDGNGAAAKGIKSVELYVPTVLAGDYRGTSVDCSLALSASSPSLESLNASGSYRADLGHFSTPSGQTSTFNPAMGLEYVFASVCTWFDSNTSNYKGNYYWVDFNPAVENDTGINFYTSLASFLPGKAIKSDSTYLENGGGYVMSDGTASTFLTSGAGPGTYLTGMTGSQYWKFVGTVSVGQVLGDPNLVSNSCFNNGSRSDAKLQYQLKQVFANADSSQQLVVYQSADQYGNTIRNSYGDAMYIVVDPRTNANAAKQQSESNDKWYNYREESNADGTASSKAGSWRLHVFNAPQSTFYMTFPQYEGTFDVSDQATSGKHITDHVQVGNESFNASTTSSSSAKETYLSYGVSTQQSSYMEAEWVGDDTLFWKMTMNADNWQNWPNGKLYVAADRSLEVVSAPNGAKVSGSEVPGGYAFVKQADGNWVNVASSLDRVTLREAAWNESCDFPTIEQNSNNNNNYRIEVNGSNFSKVTQNGKNTVTVGFFTKATGSSVQNDGTFKLKAQIVCHTGDPTLIAGANHRSWPTTSGYVNGNGQWAYRISAEGSTNTPSLVKTSAQATPVSDSSNIATTWTLEASNFNTSGSHYSHTNSPLLSAYYGGWNGRFTTGDSMRQSSAKDALGNALDINVGKYTHVTRMFPSKYPSVSENLNGGGCGPIPSKGMGGDAWEKCVSDSGQTSWRSMNSIDCYWDADAPGVYRKILTTSAGGGTSNSVNNPMVVYVYYAGNMYDAVSSTLDRSALEYAGANLGDPAFSNNSLVIEYRGLEQVNSIASRNQLNYQTELDTKAFTQAAAASQGKSGADALTSSYDVSLKNAAGFGAWIPTGVNPSVSTVEKTVTAALSIKKSVQGPESINDVNGGLYATYALDVQVGYSPSEFVNFEDHISKIVDAGNALNGSEAVVYDVSDIAAASDASKDVVSALAKASSLKNFKIIVTQPGQQPQEIGAYDESSGTFTFIDGWKTSTVSFGGYPDQPGSLFNGQIVRDAGADGALQLLPPQTNISFTYDLYLDIDQPGVVNDGSFRESDFYHGGALTLYNHAQAERPYRLMTDNAAASDNAGAASEYASTESSNGTSDAVSDVASDTALSSAFVAVDEAEPTLQGEAYVQVINEGIALAGGEIGDDGMLRTWPDADVERTFLSDQLLAKTPVAVTGDKQHIDWMFYDWTGTIGKHNPTVTLKDMPSIFIDDYWADANGLTSAQKLEKRQQLAALLTSHITVSNLEVYLVGKDEKPEIANGTTNLAGKTPLYAIDGVLSSENDGSETLADGSTISFSYQQGGATTSFDEQGASNVYASGPGFDISASGLPLNSYFASTYSMDIDWPSFYNEAVELGLFDESGNIAGTDKAFTADIKNGVAGNNSQQANSSAGQVKVDSATLAKSVGDIQSSSGIASWKLNAKTSSSVAPSELTFNDQPSFVAQNSDVAAAAQSATSIEDVAISLDGNVIYQDGTLNDYAVSLGWTDANISIDVDGTAFSVVIRNTQGASVLDKNQSYQVSYKTVLNKDVFVSALVSAGAALSDASYAIQNAATLSSGSATLSAHSDASFSPSAPISATKSAGSTPQDGAETQSASFTVAAGTGDAARKGFTLSDQLTRMTGVDYSAAAANAAMMLSAFTVTVSHANGTTEAFDAAEILNNERTGVSLSTTEGESFELNMPGIFGVDRGWKLTFDQLPANTTVSVEYTLTVDRKAYADAGGNFDTVVNLKNAFRASSADGSSAAADSTGKVKVQPDVSKKGAVSSEKSEDGNPLITWTIDTRLSQIFNADDLAKLETASVKDVLDQRLKCVDVVVQSVNTTMGAAEVTQLTAGTDYEVLIDDATNTLEVKIINPSLHPDVRVVVKTEVIGSSEGIGNAVDVVVDGQFKGESKTEVKDNLVSVTQFGSVTSVVVPTWQATAQKLVDGGAGATPAGAFTFELVQVDENGNVVEGGQAAQATNDANGVVTFDALEYGPRNIVGTYWYQLTEKATDDASASYQIDASVKTIKVTLQKAEDGNYLLSSESVADASNAEEEPTADVPTFNNISRHTLSLAKTDLQGDELQGATFRVTPGLDSTFADGGTDPLEVGAGVFQNILLAGSVYTVEEAQAPQGYQKLEGNLTFIVLSDGAYELVSADEGWNLAQDNTTVVAADAKLPSTVLQATKLVDGEVPAAELSGKFVFTATEVDEFGNNVSDGYYAQATNGADGSVVFDQIDYTQAGIHYYRIAETAGFAGNGYTYDNTVYTVKVEVTQDATRSFNAVQTIIAPESAKDAVFNNVTNPEPGTEEDQPTPEPDDNQPAAPSPRSSLAQTGDSANVMVPLVLAALAALLAMIVLRRARER